MTCDICNENKILIQVMPCCKGKKMCQTCLIRLVKKECPFCRKTFPYKAEPRISEDENDDDITWIYVFMECIGIFAIK